VCVFMCVCECITPTDRDMLDLNVKNRAQLSSVVAYNFCARKVRSMFARQLVSLLHFTAGSENNIAKRKFYEAFRSSISEKRDENSANLTNGKCESISSHARGA
jgi:hypothetical protein